MNIWEIRAPGGAPGDAWGVNLACARGLWRLMATRWLALRLPRTRQTRQRLTPESEALVGHGFTDDPWSGTDADLYREARLAGAEQTTAQLAGYLARGFAEHRFLGENGDDLDTALPAIIGRARQHAERTGRTVEARARDRLVGWVQEAESIALGSESEVHPPEADDEEAAQAGHGGTP